MDTKVRKRRDEETEAGVYDAMANQAIAGYDRMIGPGLSYVELDGWLQKSPCGREGTGENYTDRAELGWK